MTMTYYSGQLGRERRGRAARAACVSAGGNTLSHRPDAVPGYTGYTPGSMCVPPSVHTRLTERAPGAGMQRPTAGSQADAAADADAGPTTTYATIFPPDRVWGHDYSVAPRGSRSPITATSTPPVPPEQERMGKSTYHMELLQRSSADINGSACGSGGGMSGASPGARSVRPGYLTTAAASQLLIAEKFASAALTAHGGCRGAQAAPHCSSPTAGVSTGAVCTGLPASPAALAVPGGRGCERTLAPAHPAAVAGWEASHSRPSAAAAGPAGRTPAPAPAPAPGLAAPLPKDAALMYALDQHSRGRVPGYTGHRPQHDVQLELPPPSRQTTWGTASQQALRRPPSPHATSHALDSRKGLLGFFSAGTSAASGGFVSENGLAEAARYHEAVRPLEGRMKIPQASRTTARGSGFAG